MGLPGGSSITRCQKSVLDCINFPEQNKPKIWTIIKWCGSVLRTKNLKNFWITNLLSSSLSGRSFSKNCFFPSSFTLKSKEINLLELFHALEAHFESQINTKARFLKVDSSALLFLRRRRISVSTRRESCEVSFLLINWCVCSA